MLFQLVLTKFFKSELFSFSPKVDHVINSCKRPIMATVSVFSVFRTSIRPMGHHVKIPYTYITFAAPWQTVTVTMNSS